MNIIDFKALALKANQALLEGKPLVLASEAEKIAVRSYAENEYAYWMRPHGSSAS